MFSYVVDVLIPYVVVFGSSKIPESLFELMWFCVFQQVISRNSLRLSWHLDCLFDGN